MPTRRRTREQDTENTESIHPLLAAEATDRAGTKRRATRYRRGRTLAGDAYQYLDRLPDSEVEESAAERRRAWLNDVRMRLTELLPEREVDFLLAAPGVRELARWTGLEPSTWSRRLRRLLDVLKADEKLKELAARPTVEE